MITPAAPMLTWHRTRENLLAARSDVYAYLAVPTPDGAYRIALAFKLDLPPEDWTPDRFEASSLFAFDETVARDRIALLDRHRHELDDDNTRDLAPGTPTPWGKAQDTLAIAPGILRHHTASHGGYQLDPELNALVHPAYRNDGGWYEEDVEWAKVAVTFPTLFPMEADIADDMLREYHPDAYEQVNGVTLTRDGPDISWHRTRENILAANASPYSFLALPTEDGAYRIAIAPELGTPPEQWAAEDFFRSSLFAADEPAARDRIALLMRQHQELEAPSVSRELNPGSPTPWGDAHRSTQFAEGFVRYDTKGPSAYHLDPTFNALIHPAYRREDGWYEDHIEWSKVALTFPTLFPTGLQSAEETLLQYEPKSHEQVNGITPALSQPETRDLDAEREAMRRLNFPEYARDRHGYTLDWGDQTQTRVLLTRDDEQLRARKDADGAWSYQNANSPWDRGDILDFEIHRGAHTRADARAAVRPELARAEREQGRFDPSPASVQTPDSRAQDGPEGEGPDPDRRPRPGRGR